jgi:hypothetical protein
MINLTVYEYTSNHCDLQRWLRTPTVFLSILSNATTQHSIRTFHYRMESLLNMTAQRAALLLRLLEIQIKNIGQETGLAK